MAKYTLHNNLTKPEEDDYYDIKQYEKNMDSIDNTLYMLNVGKANNSELKSLQTQMDNVVAGAGNPGASSAEILQARDKENTLNERLTKIEDGTRIKSKAITPDKLDRVYKEVKPSGKVVGQYLDLSEDRQEVLIGYEDKIPEDTINLYRKNIWCLDDDEISQFNAHCVIKDGVIHISGGGQKYGVRIPLKIPAIQGCDGYGHFKLFFIEGEMPSYFRVETNINVRGYGDLVFTGERTEVIENGFSVKNEPVYIVSDNGPNYDPIDFKIGLLFELLDNEEDASTEFVNGEKREISHMTYVEPGEKTWISTEKGSVIYKYYGEEEPEIEDHSITYKKLNKEVAEVKVNIDENSIADLNTTLGWNISDTGLFFENILIKENTFYKIAATDLEGDSAFDSAIQSGGFTVKGTITQQKDGNPIHVEEITFTFMKDNLSPEYTFKTEPECDCVMISFNNLIHGSNFTSFNLKLYEYREDSLKRSAYFPLLELAENNIPDGVITFEKLSEDVIKYILPDAQKKIIAKFDFDNTITGLEGGGAKAEIVGTASYAASYAGSGQAANISRDFWLNVKKENETPLLRRAENITISYDSKANLNDNMGWVVFAAPSTVTQEHGYERYFGIMDKTNSIVVERYDNFGKRNMDGNIEVVISETGWKHVDVVMTSEATYLYVNGKLYDSKPSTVSLSNILGNSGGIFQIGKGNWPNGEYYNGQLDNFKVYNYGKSAEEIKEDYNNNPI